MIKDLSPYETALVIVSYAFKDKVDKAEEPYINHLKHVADTVTVLGPCEETRTIALLHDLLEDCPEWNERSLAAFFSREVINALVLLTKRKEQSYEEYIDGISGNSWAASVKVADLRHNMDITRLKELTEKDFERLKKYHKAYRTLYFGKEEK